jgi:hypothetical protein
MNLGYLECEDVELLNWLWVMAGIVCQPFVNAVTNAWFP